jgi:hypothetical protein
VNKVNLDLLENILAIASLILGIIGILYIGLFVGPAAIACGAIALIGISENKTLETAYKICAIVGTIFGCYEVLFGILKVTGLA